MYVHVINTDYHVMDALPIKQLIKIMNEMNIIMSMCNLLLLFTIYLTCMTTFATLLDLILSGDSSCIIICNKYVNWPG